MSIENLSSKQLRRAATVKDKIVFLQRELGRILGNTASTTQTERAPRKKKRRMSAAGRARISKAAKARWAKIKAQKK
jgi:hypothetical protein